jgi:hypothetical protein
MPDGLQVFSHPERAGGSAPNLAVDDFEVAVNVLKDRQLAPGEIQPAPKG